MGQELAIEASGGGRIVKILDRYILRRFLLTLIFALIAFALIFVVVDLIENLDKFIDRGVPREIVVRYYLFYLPYIFTLVLPVGVLLASLFSVGQMARYNELIAMRSTGVSLYRILQPLFLLGILLSLFDYYFSEQIAPIANDRKFQIKRQYVDRVPEYVWAKKAHLFVQDSPTRRVFVGFYDAEQNLARNVSIQEYESNRIRSRWDAPRMRWDGEQWVLLDGYHREFVGDQEIVTPFGQMPFAGLSFRPYDLAKVQKPTEEMSYRELKAFIHDVQRNGGDPRRWLVDLYMKIAFPFSNLVIVMFGAPLASTKRRSGPMVGFGISLAICFFYFGLTRVGVSLGHNLRIHPWLGAWIGNLLFGAAAIPLLLRAERH
jgi:lipopolysaccharide export system permease protein